MMCRTFASIDVTKYPISNREISNLSKFYTSTRMQIVIEGLPKTKLCNLNPIPWFFSNFANYLLHASNMTRAVNHWQRHEGQTRHQAPETWILGFLNIFGSKKPDLLRISLNFVCDSQIKTLWAIEMRKKSFIS